MPREYTRSSRIAEQIQRELAQLIQREIKDPRIKLVTISGVEVSRDLGQAKVYVSTFDADSEPKVLTKLLNQAAGFLRHELGQRMRVRAIPDLKFYYDATIEKGARLNKLIEDAVSDDDQRFLKSKQDGTSS